MSKNLNKGDHVFFKHKSGKTFEGDVLNIEENLERITIQNIILHPDNSEIEGLRKFHFHEILEIKRFVSNDSELLEPDTTHSNGSLTEELETNSLEISEDEYRNIIQLQKEFRYIKACDNNFYEAISVLKQTNRIGVCMQDISKGRLRRGSVVATSTGTHIFIFDIEVAGDKMFDKGLREILESTEIEKVVYDCRLLSDCLFIKHVVDLQNVLDVEANDILLVYQSRGIVRKHTRSLNYLIELYLGIPSAVVDHGDFQDLCIKRPFEVENQVLLAGYVSYLLPLQKAIEKCLLSKMQLISEFYNDFHKRGEVFAPGTGTKYTPYQELKDFLRKDNQVRSMKHLQSNQEKKNK